MSEHTFRELEHQGWLTKASAYRDSFGKITEQAIAPILDTFGDLSGKRLLDVACGTGELTAAALQRGANAEGVDFAATMVVKATEKYPDGRFIEGDAEHLPYDDSTFDAVVCSFGLLHLEHPERAIADARRVLKAGGRYTFTVWGNADQGGDFFKLVMGAITRHGTLDVPLPPAPPIFSLRGFSGVQSSIDGGGLYCAHSPHPSPAMEGKQSAGCSRPHLQEHSTHSDDLAGAESRRARAHRASHRGGSRKLSARRWDRAEIPCSNGDGAGWMSS